MVKEHSVSTCYSAIGMIEAGATHVHVAKTLRVAVRIVRNWKNRHEGRWDAQKPTWLRQEEKHFAHWQNFHQQVTGKTKAFHQVFGQALDSSRTPGLPHVCPHVLAVLVGCQTLQAEMNAQIDARSGHQEDPVVPGAEVVWHYRVRRVIFSDESPFQLFHSPIVQNDRVWVRNREDVDPSPTVKFPTKIMVWGAMLSCALTKLHIVPEKTTVTAQY